MTASINIGKALFSLPDALKTHRLAKPTLALANALAGHMRAEESIRSDRLLSEAGKRSKLAPLRVGAWSMAGQLALEASRHRAEAQSALRALLAVPPITTPYEIGMDQEIRGWWRQLDRAERAGVLKAAHDEPDKYAGIMAAVMRSPIVVDLDDNEGESVALAWEAHRRATEPDAFAVVDAEQVAAEAAERSLGELRGLTGTITAWDAKTVISELVAADAVVEAVALFPGQAVAAEQQRQRAHEAA